MTHLFSRLLLCLLLAVFSFTGHAGLAPDLQPVIRASTFEVVLKKPTADPLTYEKPLPIDLVPFIERNDQYRSIGTAFALGQNQYVSAAHVFAVAIDSQFGAPAAIAPLSRSPEEFYPNSSRRAQIEGSVVVAVQVDTSGCGRQRGIVTSSGSDDIDQAALEFIDTAEFLPAQRQGTPVDGIYKTIVHFKIEE